MQSFQEKTAVFEKFLTDKSRHFSPQVLFGQFSTYFQLLNFNNAYVTLEVTITSTTCSICNRKIQAENGSILLHCSCRAPVCTPECIRDYIYNNTNESLLGLEAVQGVAAVADT